MATNFGMLGEIIKNAATSYASRSTGPVFMNNSVQTADYNMGSLGLTAIMHNEIYGEPNDFLWTIHTWDDGIHRVAN